MNRVVPFEVHAVDPEKMQKFYESVFGWQIEDLGQQMGSYRLVNTGKDEAGAQWPGINGGIVRRHGLWYRLLRRFASEFGRLCHRRSQLHPQSLVFARLVSAGLG
jgi:hypothetical protein